MKPKGSKYVKFTFADLRGDERNEILKNAFAENLLFFSRARGRYTQFQELQVINKITKTRKSRENRKRLVFPR